MNPPAALFGAMNRERKPFTYTPGGLDLSEIKSEKMAKRLMRNAMNQGVPDTPVQSVKSPPPSGIPVAMPNFNCLPVQVFPSFQLPANPKSLLRSRSNPDGSSEPIQKSSYQSPHNKKIGASSGQITNKSSQIPSFKNVNNKTSTEETNHIEQKKDIYNLSNTSNVAEINNVIKPSQNIAEIDPFKINSDVNQISNSCEEKYYNPNINKRFTCESQDQSSLSMTMQNHNKTNLINSNNNSPDSPNCFQIKSDYCNDSITLPEICYEAEYLTTLPEDTPKLGSITTEVEQNNETNHLMQANANQLNLSNMDNTENMTKDQTILNTIKILPLDEKDCSTPLSPEIYYEAEMTMPETSLTKTPEIMTSFDTPNLETLQKVEISNVNGKSDNNSQCTVDFKDDTDNNNKQKEVKSVKKQSEQKVTENTSESQNGDTETEIVVKLPSKKSEAKTETQVEVETKVLPDGTVEEITKTTTKTTIDGKTETKITTATKTIPKEEVTEEEYEEEEEEEAEENIEEVVTDGKRSDIEIDENEEKKTEIGNTNESVIKSDSDEKNIKTSQIITGEEKSETSTTKKVVVIQSESQDSEEEIVEEEEVLEEESEIEPDVEEVVVIRSKIKEETTSIDVQEDEQKSEEENDVIKPTNETEKEAESEQLDEETVAENREEHKESKDTNSESGDEEKKEEVDDEIENSEDKKEDVKQDSEGDADVDSKTDIVKEIVKEDEKETEQKTEDKVDEEEAEETFEEAEDKEVENEEDKSETTPQNEDKKEQIVEKIIPIQQEHKKDENPSTAETKPMPQSLLKDILREPSVPLEKVEEVEIKPIGPTQEIIKKSHTEIITTKTDKPSGALSTQTEYNVIENFVTVNRTTKTLDHAYEQAAAESSIPIIRSYIPPYETSKSYQPQSYTTQPETERRHSLLLDRISVERQIPVDTYQNNLYNNNQNYQETQYLFEPQSEVLTESNVKPSTINKNQQWYHQTKKENYISNNVSSTPTYEWAPPQQQSAPKSPNIIQQQPTYQSQPQYVPEPQYQSTYIENTTRDSYKTVTDKQNVSSYTPKPSWVNSTFDPKPTLPSQPNQYSFKTQSTESYQNSTQFNSSYVPPPWEQDTRYIAENKNQDIYQPPSSNTFTPKPAQSPWQQTTPSSKFTKPKPTSYIPPAPNQSFVKPVTPTEPPKFPGRKTYYSEYERRYISVPETTYIPTETKYQAQPDPSPTYYYDNNEPAEIVEPQWRKELREFTEKSQTTTQINETSVRPPWEDDPKYGNGPSVQSTPTWSQTLRPQSWRERSYEPEYTGTKEWPKTNTLGRGRPQSSYVKNNMDRIPERPRGVSVDRYNPNNYQSPIMGEHPPVQSQTLDHNIHPKPHYNPNVPGYHARASAEPRDQPAYPQQRLWGDARSTPIQSRSFKYLQWITGTED